jgi:hypothetical protein
VVWSVTESTLTIYRNGIQYATYTQAQLTYPVGSYILFGITYVALSMPWVVCIEGFHLQIPLASKPHVACQQGLQRLEYWPEFRRL